MSRNGYAVLARRDERVSRKNTRLGHSAYTAQTGCGSAVECSPRKGEVGGSIPPIQTNRKTVVLWLIRGNIRQM